MHICDNVHVVCITEGVPGELPVAGVPAHVLIPQECLPGGSGKQRRLVSYHVC